MASKTKVAILDDYQNIALPHFQALDRSKFEVTVFHDTLLPYNSPSTPDSVKAQLVERLRPFKIICAMRERTPFPAELFSSLPKLKLLLSTGTRNASIDLDAAKKCGIRVAGATGKGRAAASKSSRGYDSTTQHIIALILGIAKNLAADDLFVKHGGWQSRVNIGLTGKTLGTVGLGRLGINVAKIMYLTFGMNIIAWSSSLTQDSADEKAAAAGLPVTDEDGEKTFKVVSKDELFRTADVVSIHYVLSARSRGLVAKEDLEKMKNSALFVNTSRGPLVVEKDLIEILKAGKIRGAALDVFDLEPLAKDSEWRSTEWGEDGRSPVLLSPHMAYVEEETMGRWYDENMTNIERWEAGQDLLTPLA